MTDISAFNATSTAGGGPSEYLVKGKEGLEKIEVDRDSLDSPKPGFYQKLQLKGIATPFEMLSQFKTNPDGTPAKQMMTRALIRVVATGTENHGKTFTQLFPFDGISARSQFGQILGAIRGRDLGPSEPIRWEEFLGGHFGGMVQTERKQDKQGFDVTYAKVVKDTVVPAAKSAPAAPAPAPTASPFDVDEDEDAA